MVVRKDVSTDEIINLYQRGLIGREIAKKLGCSVPLVQQRLEKAGVKMRPCNERKTIEIDPNVLKEMYWDKKMHPVEIGKILGVHKNTVTKKMREFGIPLRTKSESRVKELNPIYGVGHSEQSKQKMSDVVADSTKNLTISWRNPYGNRKYYKGLSFRSTWEYGFALYLDNLDIGWDYESHRFQYQHNGKTRTYVPDFYLPRGFLNEIPCFVEIKGFCDNAGKSKLHSIKSQVENLIVLYREDLIKLGIIDASGKVII